MTQCDVLRTRLCSGLAPALGRCRGTYRKQARAMGERRGAPRGSPSPRSRRAGVRARARARTGLRTAGRAALASAPPSCAEAYKRTEEGRVLTGAPANGRGVLAVLAAHICARARVRPLTRRLAAAAQRRTLAPRAV